MCYISNYVIFTWKYSINGLMGADIGTGCKSVCLAGGGLLVRFPHACIKMSLRDTPNPWFLLMSWLLPCMAANRRAWIRSINCTALWVKVFYKCWHFIICHYIRIPPWDRGWKCRWEAGSHQEPVHSPSGASSLLQQSRWAAPPRMCCISNYVTFTCEYSVNYLVIS